MTASNQGVIKHLLDSYYRDDATPADGDFVSPLWKHITEGNEVVVDEGGRLVSLETEGLPRPNWGSLSARIADDLCSLSHLTFLPHRGNLLRLRKTATRLCRAMGIDPTFYVFQQVCALELLARRLPPEMSSKRTWFVMIGDGYGILSALIKELFPNSTMVLIDIGKTLLFQAHYCQKAHPDRVHAVAGQVRDPDVVDFVYCPTEDLEKLGPFKFDVAVNIASMQEMSASTRERYFEFLRQHLKPDNRFYCCNRESRSDFGVVSEYLEYPWRDGDRHLIDGSPAWPRYVVGRKIEHNQPKLLGVRIPFVRLLNDVARRHRLTILETNSPRGNPAGAGKDSEMRFART